MLRQTARIAIQQTRRISFLKTNTIKVPPMALFQKTCVPIFPNIAIRPFNSTNVQFNDNASYTITELSTERYHRLSDELLDYMVGKLEELADETDMPGFDVEYNQGVMTISVGEHGTYVINKQPPNHQIWLSSPVSGPQRYDFDEKHHKWFYHRDNHTLEQVLNTELSKAMGQEIDLLKGFEPEEK